MQEINIQNKRLSEEEDAEPTGFLPFAERSIQLNEITYYIDEDVTHPRYYRAVVERMQSLTESDVVRCMINSTGGMFHGLTTLLEATRNTDATTLAVITGECHSAASILALAHDQIQVSPYATMLVHFVSYGASGKGQDILDKVQHVHSHAVDFFRKAYEGFLTEAELQKCIDGKQLWLVAEEIEQRLQLRETYRMLKQKELKKELKAAKKAQKKLKKETKAYPEGAHDDQVDALAYTFPSF